MLGMGIWGAPWGEGYGNKGKSPMEHCSAKPTACWSGDFLREEGLLYRGALESTPISM